MRRFDPQTVGRLRTFLSRIINPGTVKVHELSRAIEQCEERLNLTRLPDYAAVRSETETFLEARQSSLNPDAMDIGSLNGQKGVCHSCGQRVQWAAECPKRGKSGQGGKGEEWQGTGQVRQREN